jgi:hypothetical protein
MRHPPFPGPGIGDGEDPVGLDQDRRRQQQDQERVFQDHIALEPEQQHHGQQQSQHRRGLDPRGEGGDRRLTPLPHQPCPRDRPCGKRQHHVKRDGQHQRFPRHFQIRHPQKQRHDGRKGEDHDHVVQRHLHQRVVRVALGQLRPDEHHRRAGRGPQKDQTGDILPCIGGIDQPGKDMVEEQHTKGGHREGFYQPVDHKGDDQAPWPLAHPAKSAEIHRDHHRIDHRPYQKGHQQVDRGIFERGQKTEHPRQQICQHDPRNDAEEHPD